MDEDRSVNHSWIQTFTGVQIDPFSPRVEDIRIEDIAHALSMKCRYGGHTRRFCSVAQHSLIICSFAPEEHALWGLLHDAAEAYLPDIPAPIKRRPEFDLMRAAEYWIMDAVCRKFGMGHEEPEVVKQIDREIRAWEELSFMPVMYESWGRIMTASLCRRELMPAVSLSPYDAETLFLERFDELYKGDRDAIQAIQPGSPA
jgi:hypothetical protein